MVGSRFGIEWPVRDCFRLRWIIARKTSVLVSGGFCVTAWGRVVRLAPVFVVLDGRNLASYCKLVKSFAALLDCQGPLERQIGTYP